MTEYQANLLNLRLQAEGRTVAPDHDLMLWAHDEIERLRTTLRDIAGYTRDPVVQGMAARALRASEQEGNGG